MGPEEAAARYVTYIQEGRYDDVALLWAEDGDFCDPHGNARHGRSEINQFYSRMIKGITPVVRMSRFAADPSALSCVFELETRMSRDSDGQWKSDPDGQFVRSAVDWMTINEQGEIQTMYAYAAPPSRWMPAL
jgi:hypothetical protein